MNILEREIQVNMHVSWSTYPFGRGQMSIWRSGLQTLTDCAVQSLLGQIPITQILARASVLLKNLLSRYPTELVTLRRRAVERVPPCQTAIFYSAHTHIELCIYKLPACMLVGLHSDSVPQLINQTQNLQNWTKIRPNFQ